MKFINEVRIDTNIRMKKNLLLLFALLSCVMAAQNYSPINSSRDAWFEYNSWNGLRILPVRIDSVRITGNDTSYYNYKLFDFNNPFGNCINRKDTNFFMDKMVVQPNGNHLFFNQNNDTILLQPFSNLNNTWVLYRYSNGDYIEAGVSSVVQQLIFSITDSVKIITLQAKDISNNPIANIFNGKEIRIGKNNGITHFYSTLYFPADTFSFNLIGKSNPQEGITNLTIPQIYEWNIGDEFQYSGGYNQMISGVMYDYEQFIILTKTISLNNDTIVYTKDHIYYSKTYQFVPVLDSFMIYVHDTITQTVIFSAPDPLNYYSYESIENINTIYGYLFQFRNNQHFGRMKKTLDPAFVYSTFDSCINRVVGWCIFALFTYAEGIGLASQVDDSSNTCYNNYLVYYKKGSEMWGTPLDWYDITSLNSDNEQNYALTIYPNPS